MKTLALPLFLAAALATNAAPQSVTFTVITPGATFDQAISISRNGEYVVGTGGTNGFIWSKSSGLMTGLGAPMEVWGISEDGQTATGVTPNGGGANEAAVWTAGGGVSGLGNPGGVAGCDSFLSNLGGSSADGTTAAGMSWQGCTTSPMRWTQGVGLELIGKQWPTSSARGLGVTSETKQVFGWDQGLSTGPAFSRRASFWRTDNQQFFPTVTAGNPTGLGEVNCANSDGTVLGGTTQGNAYRWTQAGGLEVLPKAPGVPSTHFANGTSEDGSVLVGVGFGAGIPPTIHAVMWTDELGAVRLDNWLATQGINVSANDVQNATGVSADGKTICGWGNGSAWVIEINDDDPWTDLGSALAGTNGEPTLAGTGALTLGSPTTLQLDNALPSVTGFLVLSFTELSAPFKGGVLVPAPDLIFMRPISATGESDLAAPWPGTPSGSTIYWQFWIPDAGGPSGFAASNALSSLTP